MGTFVYMTVAVVQLWKGELTTRRSVREFSSVSTTRDRERGGRYRDCFRPPREYGSPDHQWIRQITRRSICFVSDGSVLVELAIPRQSTAAANFDFGRTSNSESVATIPPGHIDPGHEDHGKERRCRHQSDGAE